MNETATWFVWLVGSYLVGSIPFGLLIGLTKGVDIRTAGSGNVGATNTGRVLGRKWGLTCFVLDVCKGLGPTLGYGLSTGLSGSLGTQAGATAVLGWLIVAAAAMIGHIFPIWLKFKGGKGVATGLGVLLGFWPVLTLPGIAAGLIWLVTIKLTGYVSLASISAACALPPLALLSALYWQRDVSQVVIYVAVTLLLGLLVVIRHRSNIHRLRQGTEPKAAWTQKTGSSPGHEPS